MITEKEMAIISAYTGVLLGSFSEMHKYIEQILGRPVFTHELIREDIADEIKQKSKKDFCSLADNGTPAEDRYGREPCKTCKGKGIGGSGYENEKGEYVETETIPCPDCQTMPLAQYLDEYIEHEAFAGNIGSDVGVLYAYDSWRELLEQALDAYESTEQVKIRIERV